ncbi:c-type cytochrome [Spirosoma spitsbergense]|uniref:c-type cytochrome n=1 Tax=Spirosoma spitsbergense TaxID=431554 RepID=UPI00036B0F5D|nr:cytochrome c [Spirosoma spitsbergense]
MKNYTAALTLTLLLGATVTLFGLTWADLASIRPPGPLKTTPPDRRLIQQGERLVLTNCAHCHSNDEGRLTGKPIDGVSASLGRIVSANITKDSVQGIGRWSDIQLVTLLRTGVDPKGYKAHFIMPRYPLLADADMQAIVAFLRSNEYSVQTTRYTGPAHKPSILSGFISTFFIKRLPEPKQPIPLPDTVKSLLYGRYLVNSRYQCFACHSAYVQKANLLQPEKTKGYLAGGSKFDDTDEKFVYSANLTSDPETGFGRYTEAEFREVMHLGKKRSGQIVRSPMLPYPLMNNREINAIYQYLKSVPPVHHPISR